MRAWAIAKDGPNFSIAFLMTEKGGDFLPDQAPFPKNRPSLRHKTDGQRSYLVVPDSFLDRLVPKQGFSLVVPVPGNRAYAQKRRNTP